MSFLKKLRLQAYGKVNDNYVSNFAANLRQKLERGDFAAAEILLSKANAASRELLIEGCANSRNSVELAESWCQARPQSAFAQVLHGASLTHRAWQIRGGAYAKDVAQDAWQGFFAHLQAAETALGRARQAHPALVDAMRWLIQVGIGLEKSPDENRALFEAGCAIDPLHHGLHARYLISVAEKWGGSHEQMFNFARASSTKAPRGHSLHALIANAYLELFLAIDTRQGNEAARKHFQRADAKQEVEAALFSWLNATPDNLAEQLNEVTGPQVEQLSNDFAAALYICGANASARLVMQSLRGEVLPMPWCWLAKDAKEGANLGFVHDRVCRDLGVPLMSD